MRHLLIPLSLLVLTTASSAEPARTGATADSVATPAEGRARLRGVEAEYRPAGRALRTGANALLFVPRSLVSGLLYTLAHGAYTVSDPRVLESVEDVLYFRDREIGWYPLVNFSSGSRSSYGATVFYHRDEFGLSVGGDYRDDRIWGGRARLSTAFRRGAALWSLSLSANVRNRDDFAFHGFGVDPAADPRNTFRTSRSVGVYSQHLSQVVFEAGVRPSPSWEFLYTGLLRKRKVKNPEEASADNLEEVFDLDQMPGLASGRETRSHQLYSEILARFDSRDQRRRISPGVRVEGYAGLSEGVDGDESRFSRAGLDAAVFVPVIRRNRVLVPRMILDTVRNRADTTPLPFTEFPRQPTFRGVSRSELIRTDEISAVPSLEYQWPLTFNLGGHLFLDYVLVAPSLGDLSFSGAPYAVGFGIDMQRNNREVARIAFAGGSEGPRLMISAGFPFHAGSRSRWY